MDRARNNFSTAPRKRKQEKSAAGQDAGEQPGSKKLCSFAEIVDAHNRGESAGAGLLRESPHTVIPSEPTRAIRAQRRYPPPDILDLARGGGLPSDVTPYRLDSDEGLPFIAASGNSTAAVQTFVWAGLGKLVGDARLYCRTYPNRAQPEKIRELFKNLAFAPDELLRREVIDRREEQDSAAAGRMFLTEIVKRWPELAKWPPEAQERRQQVQAARPHANKGPSKRLRCIEGVQQVLGELTTARAEISIPEDYEQLRREHPEWLIFEAAKQSSKLRMQIIALPERTGRLEGLAQDVVALILGLKKTTVTDYWTHKGAVRDATRGPEAASGKPSK